MIDYNYLADFSRNHCISICAFLLPANLLTTLLTMIVSALLRPISKVYYAAGFASIFSVLMSFHVYTWFEVGVVRIHTFILLWLAVSCVFCNIGAILFRHSRMPSTELATSIVDA
jgi:hypothetical protein